MENNKIIVGVSGGPDSIYLLEKLSKENNNEIVVAHVNYHLREESNSDQKLVEKFCEENNIKCEIYDIKKTDWDKYNSNNKQTIARKQRYDFYFDLAKKYNTKEIYIAHHLNDWLETAMMQYRKSKELLFYGIQPKSKYGNFIINRPLLKIKKKEIINYLDSNKISYALDKTNSEPIYERNILRLDLAKKTNEEINDRINFFEKINKKNYKRNLETKKSYLNWEESNFDWQTFIEIDDSIKRFVIYLLLINNKYEINLSGNKLDAIVEFIQNKRGDKQYRLMENIFMVIKNSKIKILKNYGNRK